MTELESIDPVVGRLVALAQDKVREVREICLQAPEDLSGVTRQEIESALSICDAALKSDRETLRNNVSLARARLRRSRFARDEHVRLFGAIADLAFALEDVDVAATAATYPSPLQEINFPQQHLIPRSAIVAEVHLLRQRLTELDNKLLALSSQNQQTPSYMEQNVLVQHVISTSSLQSSIIKELLDERQIDLRGVALAADGLSRAVTRFVSACTRGIGKVSSAVRVAAISLGLAGHRVVSAVYAVARKSLHIYDGLCASPLIFRDSEFGPELLSPPLGDFLMGSPDGRGQSDEYPQHHVAIGKPFALARYAVTFSDWDIALDDGGVQHRPDDQGWGRGKRPVINVSWDGAIQYTSWLSKKVGVKYRLPSEAEWEYCCRAGTTTEYSTGNNIRSDQAQFSEGGLGSSGQTVPVGSFEPNPWGFFDMHGNVWEWCLDEWHSDYSGAPTDGSAWLYGNSEIRPLRGGSWDNNPRFLRSADRSRFQRDGRRDYVGFRVARTL